MVHIAPPPGWVVPAMASDASLSSSALSVSSISLPKVEPVVEQVPVTEATLPIGSTSSFSPLMLWGTGAAAFVLIGGLVGLVIFRGGEAAKSSTPLVVMSEPSVNTGSPENPSNREIAVELDTTVDGPTIDSPVEGTVVANEEATESAVLEAVSAETTDGATAKEIDTNSNASVPATNATADTSKPAASDATAKETNQDVAAAPEPVLKFDPLDFNSMKLNATSTTPSTTRVTSVSESSGDAAGKVMADEAARLDSDAVAAPAKVPAITVRLGPTDDAPPPPRDVAKQLSLPVAGFDGAAMPLSQLVDIVADMADLPITLDPVALETVGVSPRDAAAVNVQNVTLEKVLRDALASRHLDLIERDGQLVIAKPNSDRQRPVDYEVKDLIAAGETDAAAIGALIQKFVAPASWKTGGAGTVRVEGTKLHVEQADGVQYQILIFCERLRIARGLPTRSRYPVARLSTDSSYAKLAAQLSRETTFTYLPWTRLDNVTKQWQDSSGVTVLVDWAALASTDLSPSSPLACSTLNRPWSETWDKILAPVGLGWWAVDGETIQITTQAALDELQRVEFCDVPKPLRDQFVSTDAMIELLTKELTDHFTAAKHSSSPPQFEISADESSGRLIVLGNVGVQRFLSDRLYGKP